jgi:hypothetical protein
LSAKDDTTLWSDFVGRRSSLTFFVFPVIDWHFRFQRPQQLSLALVRMGHRVVYLSPDFATNPRRKPFEFVGSPHHNVFLYRLSCPPPQPRLYESLLSAAQLDDVGAHLASLAEAFSPASVVRLVQHPFWGRLMRYFSQGLLVYDLMDEHSAFLGSGSWIPEEENDLVREADLVTVTSSRLFDRSAKASRRLVLPNAADIAHFSKVTPRPIGDLPFRLGYYGAISHWFDTTLITESAKAHPEWEFELVGSTFQAALGELPSLRNIKLVGEQEYAALPEYLSRWDVALIPFKDIPLTRATNPVKIYEYLAAGKPVVATRLAELQDFSDWVYLASGPEEFVAQVENAAAEGRDPELAVLRKQAVEHETWDNRAHSLTAELRAWPLVSVVVLCYGKLELTKRCLRSAINGTAYPNWELIVVDNASPDGTRDWLLGLAQNHGWATVLLNDDNVGFSAGNNIGVRESKGEYVVLLNNDTMVTPGWLERIVRHLSADESLGLVGPVTNAIGNEARIALAYSDDRSMFAAARRYVASHYNCLTYVDAIAFFAVGLRRTTWDTVGELDERFGLGFFEDDDYCRRARAAGFRIAIADDVFIHHELSAAFDSLGPRAKQEQFERNRRLFEEKWGPWTPHKYRDLTDAREQAR